MELQNFYLIALIICVNITFTPTIEVEDSNHHRIGGDRHYHDCSTEMHGDNHHKRINFQNETFWLHAKVLGSLMQEKIRGPYDNNTCYHIHGTVGHWYFDEVSCQIL
ncbi:7978_t:CDS:2 [Gigaspora margarita]|uniref:7978_t:CDS:1 n=1 Tax=Gigaspora margarita TaxID=4874 RepID=A0ABN7UIF1_GIGMA|nr:7978_t:CDS:2 [Gigaspora margarita]